MEKVGVLGLGNWGTALANHLALGGNEVLGWSIQPEIVEGINTRHINPLFQSDVTLESSLRATASLEEVLGLPTILLVIPSAALSDVVPKLKLKPDTLIISAVKGLEAETHLTPLQYCEKNLRTPAGLCVISGPSFAKDIVRGGPAGIVAAAKDQATARFVAELFTIGKMKVYYSTDPIGVELGGISKNIIAVAAGIADALNLGDSARAGLITRGLAEMTRLAEALGARRETLFGLSGMGDLVMTSTCDTSRNRTVGLRLGKGESLEHIVETLGSTAEGVKTAPILLDIAREHGVEMPISASVEKVIKGEIKPEEMLDALIQRPVKPEFD